MAVASKAAPKTGATRSKKPTSRDAASSGANQAFFNDQAKMFDIAAHPTRLRILWMLDEEPRNVGTIGETIGQRQPAISHHLTLMRAAGYVESRQEGKNRTYSITERGGRVCELLRYNLEHRS